MRVRRESEREGDRPPWFSKVAEEQNMAKNPAERKRERERERERERVSERDKQTHIIDMGVWQKKQKTKNKA